MHNDYNTAQEVDGGDEAQSSEAEQEQDRVRGAMH